MATKKSGKKRPARRVTPSADKKAPFARVVPRPVRRTAGRTTAPLVPVNIRTADVKLAPEQRAYIRERLGRKLGKFALSIERVSLRIRDVNGPAGGIDTECRIKVVLSGLPSVVVSNHATTVEVAVNRALDAAERYVRRSVRRRRTKPLKAAKAR